MVKKIVVGIAIASTSVHAAPCPMPDSTLAACSQKTLHQIGAESSFEVNPQD